MRKIVLLMGNSKNSLNHNRHCEFAAADEAISMKRLDSIDRHATLVMTKRIFRCAIILVLSLNISISSAVSKSGEGASSLQQAKLPVAMMLPNIIQTKTKYYVISQGNSEFFRKQFNMVSNSLGTDTQVIVYEFFPANAFLRKLTNANFVRSFFGSCINGNKIYIAGGYDSKGNPTSSLFEFDITTKKWAEKKAMIQARTHFALECVGGKLYAMGGENSNGSIEVYKAETDKWEKIIVKSNPANLKPLLEITASTVIEDKIYLLEPSLFRIFKPSDGVISEGPKPLIKSNYFDIAISNKKIYVAGGTTENGNDDGVYLFNVFDNSWSNVGKVPNVKFGSGLTYSNNMLLFLGGSKTDISKPAEPVDEINIYSPSK